MGVDTRPSRGTSTDPVDRPVITGRLTIDERACVRSGVCTSLAPHRFALSGDQTVVVDDAVDDAATGPDADAVADAIACCPGAAIMIVDAPDPVGPTDIQTAEV